MPHLLGALSMRRRLPLRSDPSRQTGMRLHPRVAQLCARSLCPALYQPASAVLAPNGPSRRTDRRRRSGCFSLSSAMTDITTQVCVLGGGPAGSVFARRLAEMGHDTLLIHRAMRDSRWRVESFAHSILSL